MDNGELFVMTRGAHQMPRWPVDSLATQEQVSFTISLVIQLLAIYVQVGMVMHAVNGCVGDFFT